MLKRALALVALTLSFTANAANVTYRGYTLDTDTNIVTGGGLNWLQWDVTDGMSIEEATAAHSGWRLATNVEMAALFNTFTSEIFTGFDALENTSQFLPTGSSPADPHTEGDVQFVTLFGNTYGDCPCLGALEAHLYAGAIFGQDLDGDALYNIAVMEDDLKFPLLSGFTHDSGKAELRYDEVTQVGSDHRYGVALVSQVPIPAAGYLFMSALFGLLARNRLTRR